MSMNGWVVVVEGFNLAAKTRIRFLLQAGGAHYVYSISPKVTHLLLRDGESLSSYKESQLREWNIKVIHDLPEALARDPVSLDVFEAIEEPPLPSTLPIEPISFTPGASSTTKKDPTVAKTATMATCVSTLSERITQSTGKATTAQAVSHQPTASVSLPAPPAPRAVKSQKRPDATPLSVKAASAQEDTTHHQIYSTARTVKVFVSSTFADMKSEREQLVSVVFPEVRASCAARHIDFSFVDMRWGITDEMTAGGETIAACLREVDSCRPFFIGVLGNRYGWCDLRGNDAKFQLSLKKAVEAGFDWVRRFSDRSVTELEMLYGALVPALQTSNDAPLPPMFFIRNSSDQSAGKSDAAEALKLADLHNRVRASFSPSEYSDMHQLGELVRTQLLAAIAKRYPPESDPTPAQMEDAAHEKTAADHEASFVSQGNSKSPFLSEAVRLEQDLLDWIHSPGTPAILVGTSGSGKSALISHLLFTLRSMRPKDRIIAHFVGCTDQSSDFVALMRRIVSQLAEHFNTSAELPEEPEAVADAFRLWINGLSVGAAARKRAVILLDGFDHLQSLPGAADLHWLPTSFPSNVSVVVSVAPGRTLEILSSTPDRHGWKQFEMQPLQAAARRALVDRTLAKVGKKLDPVHADAITADNTRSPLFLRVVLSELCAIGNYDNLSAQLATYLKPKTVADLFSAVIARWEASFNSLLAVSNVLLAVAGTRQGAAEFEIVKAFNIPHRAWSTFFSAVKDFLPVRGSLITFIHDELKEAVLARYSDAQLSRARLALCKYFEEDPSLTARKALELPYLLEQCKEKVRLKTFFSDLRVFAFLFEPDETRYEFIRRWRIVGDGEVFPAVAAYKTALSALGTGADSAQTESFSRMYFLVGDFFRETSQNEASMESFKHALKLQENLMRESSGSIDDQRRIAKLMVETLDGLCSICKRLEKYPDGVAYEVIADLEISLFTYCLAISIGVL